MIILFLGTDASGKNTLMHALSKEYDYKYFMSPRSPICNIVYDDIYKRITDERFFHNVLLIENFLRQDAFFILVHVKPEILLERAKTRNEKHVVDLKTFQNHQRLYDHYFNVFKEYSQYFDENKHYQEHFIKIDNSSDINNTVKRLKAKFDKYADRNG
jgi:thymidylate kinase